ncbi:MAG: 30S ribosomal protein S12 methylthiotransferase RimO [Muribaculaceae bacterium]|nr:30S ribosomal protein S12 methylthiotransferase RimO [Muribaculaceae bacterium]
MARKKVEIVSLGCSKNLVDSERLLAMLGDAGLEASVVDNVTRAADVAVINTCGFIGDAKEESVNTILETLQSKGAGRLKKVYVMGCLSQRYRSDLEAEVPEVDGWYGKFDWPALVSDLVHDYPGSAKYDRIITTPRHHAYLKIAEGCNRFCAFCAIPLITGRFRSRSIDDIVDETRMLVDRGVKEFNVIAQDLSSYGTDIYGGRMMLPELTRRLAEIPGVEWLRMHYAYPAQFPMELMDVMAEYPNVCNYLDIALQHISDPVLTAMRRHITSDATRRLIGDMRDRVPGLHLRTTLMVGFPGEGDREFDELMRFVEETRFERMGAFAYCEEDDTWAAHNLPDAVPAEIKQHRLERLMDLQERISLDHQEAKVGSRLRVIIDREEPEYYIGRTEWDSPEVDPEVLIAKDKPVTVGEFCHVRVDSAMPFELMAHVESD